ncbi:MAG: hypothetical protein IVW57_19325, partial [Ktedonobacterales bacterium]|nr:hypothetical protein [Ktedonobacterales bacterium]
AGAELFGLWGALFASPVAGVVQAVVVTFWSEYRRTHPEEFPGLVTVAGEDGPRPPGPDRHQPGRGVRRPRDFRGVFFRWRAPARP